MLVGDRFSFTSLLAIMGETRCTGEGAKALRFNQHELHWGSVPMPLNSATT